MANYRDSVGNLRKIHPITNHRRKDTARDNKNRAHYVQSFKVKMVGRNDVFLNTWLV